MNVALFITLTIDAISIITKTEASPFWGWNGKSKAKHWNGYQNKKNPICSSGQCVLAWKCPEDAIFRESTGSCTYWTNGPWVCCDITTIQERSPKSTLSSNPSNAPGGYSKQVTKTSWKQKTITESYVYDRKERLSTPRSESTWTKKARPTPISSVGDVLDSGRERSISSRPVNNPTKIPLIGVRKTTVDSDSQRPTRISSTRATRDKTHTSEFRIVFPTENVGWTQKVTKRPASNTHTSKKTSDYKPATKIWSTHQTTKVAWRPSTRLPGRTKSTTTIKPAASTRTWIRPTSNSSETRNQGRATATPAQDHITNSRSPSSSVRTTSRYRSTTPLPNVNIYMCGIRDKRPLTNRQRRNDYNPDVDIIHSEPRNSNRKPYQRIVGGEEAKPFSWPWVAALYKVAESGGHRFLSAGSLINENFVLTAAHVFTPEDLRTASYVVMLGTHDAQNAVAEYVVSLVMLHPNYEHRFYYHDIALMRLEKPVAFNGYVMPVCLPSPNAPLLRDRDLEGKNVTVMGWGDDSFGGKSSRVLKEATFPIVSRSSCNASYVRVASNRFPRGITEEMLCAGDPNGGKDACQGDSGGPLTSVERGRHTQVGIVSFGYQCGDRDFPGVYTKVAPYLSWIAENTKDYIKNSDYRG